MQDMQDDTLSRLACKVTAPNDDGGNADGKFLHMMGAHPELDFTPPAPPPPAQNANFTGDGKLAFMLGLMVSDDDGSNPSPSSDNPPSPDSAFVPPASSPLDLPMPESLDDVSDDALFSMFSNCMGHVEEMQGSFLSVVETQKRRRSFLGSGQWIPSSTFHALPYVHARRRLKRVHHFANVYISTMIVALELGFDNPIDYVKGRGWMLRKKGGKVSVQYRKLEHIIKKFAPNGEDGLVLFQHFHAMVDALYKMIDDDALKHIYSGNAAVRVLDKKSLISKLNLFAQEFQMAVLIVQAFFIEHVPTNQGDLDYWVKRIMKPCITHDDLLHFFHNVWSIFEDGGNKELATSLLTNYPDSMRDKVGRQAASTEHKYQYALKLKK